MIRQFSAGGAVFKEEKNSEKMWIVIQPRPSKEFPNERYQLPKGLIDNGESVEEAAIREVFEESGIKAKIISKLDHVKMIYKFQGDKIFKIVTYFLMEYQSAEPTENDEVEKVLWLSFEEARKLLTYPSEKKILDLAASGPGTNSAA